MRSLRRASTRIAKIALAFAPLLFLPLPSVFAGGYKLTTLYSFTGGADGWGPSGPVTFDAAGNMYGSTFYGGAHDTWDGFGTLYKIDAAGHFSVLHTFDGAEGGSYPNPNVTLDGQGNIYGATNLGGANSLGAVYKLDAAGNYSVVHSFNDADGAKPAGGVTFDAAGNMYGAAARGGNGYGTVFKIDTAGNYSTPHVFNDVDGTSPRGVTLDAQGNMYGATAIGGANNVGTVFKIAADGAFSTLHVFDSANGETPYAGVTVDAAGNIYGTTAYGGADASGTVFKIAADGAFSTLHNFTGWSDGAYLYGPVTLDATGNIYGTTAAAGDNGGGTVFKIDAASGVLSTLFSFNFDDGFGSMSGVTIDAAGNIYGTTQGGGAYGSGTVFRLSAVPEPASLAMLGLGAGVIGLCAVRRKARANAAV